MGDEWTLKDYVDLRITNLEHRLEALDRLLQETRKADQEAVAVAKDANERRLNLLNEFRGTVEDMMQEFMRQEAAELRFDSMGKEIRNLEGKHNSLNDRFSSIEGRFIGTAFVSVLLGIAAIIYSFTR